ncbi:hypothetical protein SDC9_110952 [bioreactor metagenome]|uniref:Uncharacterized protein n=1 Tax=bioreactor metagenome TaxID=1076179 RepID=A0A645BFZ9_9ZZZZ
MTPTVTYSLVGTVSSIAGARTEATSNSVPTVSSDSEYGSMANRSKAFTFADEVAWAIEVQTKRSMKSATTFLIPHPALQPRL